MLALDNYTGSISSYADPHTHSHTLIHDWLGPYTNSLPLITIKIVTLVFMQHKHTRAELRMARLFIVVLLTKGPSMMGAYVQPDLCRWRWRLRNISRFHMPSLTVVGSNPTTLLCFVKYVHFIHVHVVLSTLS